MSRFEQVRANLRRAYEASRETVRNARRADADLDGDALDLQVKPGWRPPDAPVDVRLPDDQPPDDQPPDDQQPDDQQPGAAAAPATYDQRPAQERDQRRPSPRPRERPAPIDDAVPRSLRIAAAWSWRLIVIGIVVYALLWLVGEYMLLVAPLLIALLLTGLLMPAQRLLLKVGVHRSLGALLVVVAGLAVVGGTLTMVINQFIGGLGDIVEQVEAGVEQVQEWLQTGPFGMTEEALQGVVQEAQEWLEGNTRELTQAGLAALTGAVQFLTGMIFAIVVTFFFLRDGSRIWRFLVGLLPEQAREPMAFAGEGAWRSLSGYVRATVLVALVDAVGIGLGLWILSEVMTYPPGLVLPLAALVFLGGFVPIVGAFVSGTVAVLIGLVSGDTIGLGLIQAAIVFGIVLLVQQLESNVLQPFIVSRFVRVHPLAVLIAVLGGILLAGIIGALVAVPIVAVINTVFRRVHHYQQLRRDQGPPSSPARPPGPEPEPTG